jgi:uncharacterized repeat protein (TIGR01451 family)
VPSVAIRVRVPAEVGAGRQLTYTIVAENLTRADAHHVVVRLPVPSNAKFVRATPEPDSSEPILLWKLGTLQGLRKRDIRLVVEPTGEGDVSCCARVQFEHGQCVRTKLNRPGLDLRRSGPREGAVNDMLKFKLEVRNTGRSPARNVVVEETLPAGLEYSNSKPSTTGDKNPLVWNLGTLAPGAVRVVEYDAIVTKPGTLACKGLVRADGGVRRQAEGILRVGQATLAVIMTGPRQGLVGRLATYRLTVTNTGTLPATHVALSDELPGEITFVGASGGGRVQGKAVRWDLGSLAAGDTRSVQLVVRARRAGTLKNFCTMTADRGVTEQGKAVTKFVQAKGLALELDKSSDPVQPDGRLTLTVRAVNAGESDEKNVSVVVKLPEGLTALEVRDLPKSTIKDGKVVLPALASVAAGREQAAVIELRADKVGDYTIQAEATSDRVGPDESVKAEESLIVAEPRRSALPETNDRQALRTGKKGKK